MIGPQSPPSAGDGRNNKGVGHDDHHDDDGDDDIGDNHFGNNNGTMATILMAGWNDTDARSKMFALYVAPATLRYKMVAL